MYVTSCSYFLDLSFNFPVLPPGALQLSVMFPYQGFQGKRDILVLINFLV